MPSDPKKWASIRERKRGDGTTAYGVLYWIAGRQSQLTFNDEKSAAAFRSAVHAHGPERALEMHGINLAPKTREPGMTVAGWIRHHIDHLTGVEQSSIDSYNRYLRMDIAPVIGDIPLAKLAEKDISRWIKVLESTKREKTGRVLTPKSIANLHGFLSGALEAAVPERIPTNPAAKTRLPRRTDAEDDPDEIRMLSRDEFNRLLAATTEPWRPLVEFLVSSGARWGEATALKPSDVDRATAVVRVGRRAWKYNSNGYRIGSPKTKRSRRDVNLDPALLDKLDYTGEWLFTNTVGGPVRYQGFRRRVWDKAVQRAKLEPAPTPHDLRHTHASWLLNAGVPITTVSRRLGHENIQTTVNIYGHLDRSSDAAAAAVMGKLLN
jgi:integrase